MNAFILMTGSGALAVLTSYASVEEPALLRKLSAKGIDKFLAFPLGIALVKERYGAHFDIVVQDLGETDDLRVLDYNGERAFKRFRFDELGPLVVHEARPELATDER